MYGVELVLKLKRPSDLFGFRPKEDSYHICMRLGTSRFAVGQKKSSPHEASSL